MHQYNCFEKQQINGGIGIMDNCIFCKIAQGEIPSNTIYEDDSFRVILDNGPATKGHALVLPKEHYADLFEIPEDVLAGASKVAKKVAGNLKDKLSCDGLNLIQNNGEAAGQTVMHFHLHIIPRYENDGQHILWKPTSPSAEELVEIKNTIVGA
jgi:histidine triad (HIT) family protein